MCLIDPRSFIWWIFTMPITFYGISSKYPWLDNKCISIATILQQIHTALYIYTACDFVSHRFHYFNRFFGDITYLKSHTLAIMQP